MNRSRRQQAPRKSCAAGRRPLSRTSGTLCCDHQSWWRSISSPPTAVHGSARDPASTAPHVPVPLKRKDSTFLYSVLSRHGLSAHLWAIQCRETGHTAAWAVCATDNAVRAILGYKRSHCPIRHLSCKRRVRHCPPLLVMVQSQTRGIRRDTLLLQDSDETSVAAEAPDPSRWRMPPTFSSTGWLASCTSCRPD